VPDKPDIRRREHSMGANKSNGVTEA
jgi:hypothetical protein